MREVLIGLGLAGVTCAGLALLPGDKPRDVTAILLVFISAIYIGFAIGSHGQLAIFRQVAGFVFFAALALLGLWVDWWFLAAGLALHGAWDYLHHGRHGRGIVPQWYVPFCAVYDWALALFVAVYYAAQG